MSLVQLVPNLDDLAVAPALLTIRGTLKPPTIEAARSTHNATAGNPDGVRGAQSLGDLSHAVFVPLDPPTKGAGELLIMDYWNSLGGLQKFFGDPQVQQGGGANFESREPCIWRPASDLPSLFLPPPAGKNDRFVGLIRGVVKSREDARRVLPNVLRKGMNLARQLGHLSRTYFWRVDPANAESRELIGVDTWRDAAGMGKFYSSIEDMAAMGALFEGRPDASVWQKPQGEWVEW